MVLCIMVMLCLTNSVVALLVRHRTRFTGCGFESWLGTVA